MTMDNTTPIEVGFNAARVCEAIARIGYEPHTAIMDLVDNSVTANATAVKISLYLAPGKSLKARNSVRCYQIVDNGHGMDEKGIQKAFALGADVTYEKNSLSKYGLGLKSAGLSLGSRINIVSKQNGKFSARYMFDKEVIAQAGKFVIIPSSLTPEQQQVYEVLLPEQSGTIVEVEGSETVNHPSPNSTVEKLKERLGVVYFSFLKRPQDPLKLYTRVSPNGKEEPFEAVVARDMLFTDSLEFKEHYNPDTYDYCSPYLALDEDWKIQGISGADLPAINVKAVVFPQDSMASSTSPLPQESKNLVDSYRISRENKGFFIYRNGRLIRWGDDLDGLIGKDDINIRIRMALKSEHDDVLHVDVTKQRLEIDDENLKKLKGIITKARVTAENVRKDCQKKLQAGSGKEGAAFTSTVKNVAEDDPDELAAGDTTKETQSRRQKRSEIAAQIITDLQQEIHSGPDDNTSATTEEFRKIVYSEKVPYGHVWHPYYDAKEGIFVCINKQHPFYQEVITRMPENAAERVSLEALIFAAAVGESNVRDNLEDLTPEQLDRVFSKFHKNIGTWLNEWTSENTNIFLSE